MSMIAAPLPRTPRRIPGRRLRLACAALIMQVPLAAMAQSEALSAAPSAPIDALYGALRHIQDPSSGSTAQRAQALAPVVDRAYNLHTVLRNSVGLRFEQLSPADQDRLLQAFRQYTVARYVSTFKPGSNARFTISPQTRALPGGLPGAIVDTKIGGPSDDGTEVDYVMHQDAGAYRIDDVLLNAHISQVATNRADFSATLARGGVDALIAVLNRKTQSFLNG